MRWIDIFILIFFLIVEEDVFILEAKAFASIEEKWWVGIFVDARQTVFELTNLPRNHISLNFEGYLWVWLLEP